MVTKKIFLKSSDEVLHLLGQQDENLRRLERDYGVQIFVRQGGSTGDFSLVVRGGSGKVDKVLSQLECMREKRNDFPSLEKEKKPLHVVQPVQAGSGVIYVTYQGKNIKPRSEHQKKYVEYINKYDIVMAVGPAGTGKTFLAVACALDFLQSGKVGRIVLTRPVVEAGEKLGFLPGDLYEKINPYLKPLYDAFFAMLGHEKFRFLKEDDAIEIVPLAYMRGRTLDDAFIILDEAQNTTTEQMKMLLTRMGAGSKVVVTGDVTQIDLEAKKQSGLVMARKVLDLVEGIRFVNFSEEDVVRHELVKKVIKAYEKWETGENQQVSEGKYV
ncbi:MAG: PhoH family protein [Elusimicrobia bacterium]|nr:PhoH family protein [Candidatus Liberimonas magnetica]